MILTGKKSKAIALITAYRPCSNSPRSAGDKTVYMQQFRTLLAHATSKESTSTPDPHRQFILDMQAWISHLQEQGHSIILCLDSNENLNSMENGRYDPLEYNNGSFIQSATHSGTVSSMVTTCGLIYTLAYLHPLPYPSTYAYSKNRLDCIFISRDLAPSIIHSGVLPLYSVFHSDHNAVYLDRDSHLLFGEETHPIQPPRHHSLQLKDPRKVDA
jgi:hypothetical protein